MIVSICSARACQECPAASARRASLFAGPPRRASRSPTDEVVVIDRDAHVLRIVAKAGDVRGNDRFPGGEIFPQLDGIQAFSEGVTRCGVMQTSNARISSGRRS